MPRKTRAERQAETRQRLSDSAQTQFSRKGFAAATIDEIAEGAGFSRGAFYSNFSTKEDLAVALLDRQMAADVARFTELARAAHGNPGKIAEELRAAYQAIERQDDLELLRLEMLMLARRSDTFAARCRTLFSQQHERAIGLIGHLFAAAGRVPPMDPALLASMILALRSGAALLHVAAGPVPLGQIVEGLFVTLTAAGAQARTAASEAA